MRIQPVGWYAHSDPRVYSVGDVVEVAWGTRGLAPGPGETLVTRLTGGVGMILEVQSTRVMIRFVNGSTWWVEKRSLEKKVVNVEKVE